MAKGTDFRKLINDWLHQYDVTAYYVAKRAGISRVTLYGYLRHEHDLTARNLERVLDVFVQLSKEHAHERD